MKLDALIFHDLTGNEFMVSPDDITVIFEKDTTFNKKSGCILLLSNGTKIATLEDYHIAIQMIAERLTPPRYPIP